MEFKTTFNCGDEAWVYYGRYFVGPHTVIVGKVSVEYIDNPDDTQVKYKESYMCEETGIGSGTVFTLGEHIFKTREECEAKYADKIVQDAKEKEDQRLRDIQNKLKQETYLRMQLAEIEKIKEGING